MTNHTQQAVAAWFCDPARPDAQLVAHRRGFVAALRAPSILGGAATGVLLVLGIESGAQDLKIPVQGQHIRVRHGESAGAVIRAIPEALKRITYVRRRTRSKGEHTVVGLARSGQLVLVGIIVVPAEDGGSQMQEARVTTADFVDRRDLNRRLRNGQLRPWFRFAP